MRNQKLAVINPAVVCKMIKKKSGLQSTLFFPVTAYTLKRATNLASAQIRSNPKRMSRPHCDRHLSGKGDNIRAYERNPHGVSTTDSPLSGLRIRSRETNSQLQAGS